jgi:hypothetical protein
VDFPKVLQPGQVGKIKVKVDAGKNPGIHSKTVTIVTDDPTNRNTMFQFNFNAVK